MLTNAVKIPADLVVGDTQNPQSQRCQIPISFPVRSRKSILKMLRPIQFNDQFCFVAVKIYNVISYHILSVKPWLTLAQEIVPQKRFFLCLVLSQISCQGCQFAVSFHFTASPQIHRTFDTPSRGGGGSPKGESGVERRHFHKNEHK